MQLEEKLRELETGKSPTAAERIQSQEDVKMDATNRLMDDIE